MGKFPPLSFSINNNNKDHLSIWVPRTFRWCRSKSWTVSQGYSCIHLYHGLERELAQPLEVNLMIKPELKTPIPFDPIVLFLGIEPIDTLVFTCKKQVFSAYCFYRQEMGNNLNITQKAGCISEMEQWAAFKNNKLDL